MDLNKVFQLFFGLLFAALAFPELHFYYVSIKERCARQETK